MNTWQWIERATQWLGPWVWWLTALSFVMVVGSIVLLPVLVVRMPADYFVRDDPPTQWTRRHPAARLAIRIGRNLLGAVLLAAGFVMLFTPGQGVLALLAGLSFVDLPGKRQLERRLVALPYVLRGLNAIRRRTGHPPLLRPRTAAER
jgi:hypothetical protein